jgi:hypothetical protein
MGTRGAAVGTAPLRTGRQGQPRDHHRDRSQTPHAAILRLFQMATRAGPAIDETGYPTLGTGCPTLGAPLFLRLGWDGTSPFQTYFIFARCREANDA